MEVLDSATSKRIMRAVSSSTLAGGVYGGSMEATIDQNVRELLEKSRLGRD